MCGQIQREVEGSDRNDDAQRHAQKEAEVIGSCRSAVERNDLAGQPPGLLRRQEKRQVLGTVVIGTVEGDIHEIGKSLVATMLAAAGFQVHDLGVDVPVDKFVKQVQETGANVVGLSALLTTTMRNQGAVIEALKEAGLCEKVKVVIGGAPASPEWAETIGADAYAENANEAVGVVRQLLGV